MVILFLIFHFPFCFPQWLYHLYPYQQCTGFQFLHSLANTCVFLFFLFFDSSHPNGCELVSHSIDLLFHDDLVMLSIFSCAYWPLEYLLWRSVYSSPFSIFQMGCLVFCFCFRSSFYVLGVNPLPDI